MWWLKRLLCILLPIMATFIASDKVFAKDELYVTDWVVEAEILENGDLKITEDISYEFNDKFSGVYRDLYLNKTSGITDISVQEIKGDRHEEYARANKAKNGDSGVYTIKESKKKIQVKIYSPSDNDIKTFRYSYTVKNVVVRYNDTAELYYKFVGKDNETAAGKLLINIYLPKGGSYDKVKLYAHGPSNGWISKIDNRHYQLIVEGLPERTYVEGRVLFPTELVSLSENIKQEDRYESIIAEERAILIKQIKYAERKDAFYKRYIIINFFAFIIAVLIIAYALIKCKRSPGKNPDGAVIDLEQECSPAMASLITHNFGGINVVFASILDLFRKGYISLDKEQDELSVYDNKAFIIKKQKEADSQLLGHEKYLMEWLFFRIGSGKEVSTRDIEGYGDKNKQKLLQEYSDWRKSVKADAEKMGYYDKSKGGLGAFLIAVSIVVLIIGFLTASSGIPAAILSIIMGFVLLIYGCTLFSRLSDYGYDIYRKLINLKNYVKLHSDFSDTDKNVPDISLIYALALNTLAIKPKIYSADESFYMKNWLFWYFFFASDENNSLRKSMDASFAPLAYTADGTGFTDGGGAGAGGGGTGGF